MIANPVTQAAPFNWRNPDYAPVFRARMENLSRLRAKPSAWASVSAYYRDHPAAFISDWGVSSDPRLIERGISPTVPFVLFPRQVEWIEWAMERWRKGEPGITEKSRDSGASWLTIALACTLCLFNRGMVIGFGSRKEVYVDERGSPKSLFEKARFFLSHLPAECLGGWQQEKHAPTMRILFPGTGSAMTGEAGENIGRGDRTSIYFVDEAAFLERPSLIDASLSATTNCRIDVSTPNGRSNPFAIRRHSGNVSVFTMHWSQDPRKDTAWYEKQCRELDPVTVAAEIDINYAASVEGILIPAPWVHAAIGAHLKLGIEPTGMRRAALDVADQGVDKNAFCGRRGILLEHLEQWSGKNSDIYQTVVKTFGLCDAYGYDVFDYDADGLGAGVRGDARRITEDRDAEGLPNVTDSPFRGSGAVYDPEGSMVPGRKNKDFFANAKAQAWWSLRIRFQNTYRAVVEKLPFEADELISINPDLVLLTVLAIELSQPTFSVNSVGKILVDKAPDGSRSPNLADAVMISFAPSGRLLETWARLGQ